MFDPSVEPEGRNSAAAKTLVPSASVLDLKSAQVMNTGGNAPAGGSAAAGSGGLGGSGGGASSVAIGGGGAGAGAKYCKLCIRSFGLMRGKNECANCKDRICSDCCKNKSVLPNDPKKVKKTVCDACFGELSGMLKGEIVSVQRIMPGASMPNS